MYICWSEKRIVQISTSRTTSTISLRKAIIKTQIFIKLTHPGFIEKQMREDTFHPGSLKLCSKITRQSTWQPPRWFTQRTPWDNRILGRGKNTLDHIWLVIWSTKSPYLHARLHRKRNTAFPAKNTNKVIISTILAYTTKLWRTAAVYGTRRWGAEAKRIWKKNPASYSNIPVLCKSSV